VGRGGGGEGGGMKRSVEKKDRAGSRMKKTQKRRWKNSKLVGIREMYV
jgi:hypothetical protein